MQFLQMWGKNKLVFHICIAEKNLKLALKIPHLFAIPVVESGQKKRGSIHTALKALLIWLLNKIAAKSGFFCFPKIFEEGKIRIAIQPSMQAAFLASCTGDGEQL